MLGVARGEEGVLGGTEPCPERLLLPVGGRAGALPLAHQLAEAPGGRAPVGRRRQRLGLGGQPLLDLLGTAPLFLLLGVVLTSPPRVRGPCRRETTPQRVVSGLLQPGELLPAVHEGAHSVDA